MMILKLLTYIEKIGVNGIAPSKLSTNSRYTAKIIETLQKYDLIEIYGERFKQIRLSEKGLKLYNLINQINLILEGKIDLKVEKLKEVKQAPKILEQTPSFLKDNPWISVLSRRGENA